MGVGIGGLKVHTGGSGSTFVTPLQISGVTGWFDFTDASYNYAADPTPAGYPDWVNVTGLSTEDLRQTESKVDQGANVWSFTQFSVPNDFEFTPNTVNGRAAGVASSGSNEVGATVFEFAKSGGGSLGQVALNRIYSKEAGSFVLAFRWTGQDFDLVMSDNGINRWRHYVQNFSAGEIDSVIESFDSATRSITLRHPIDQWLILSVVHGGGTLKGRVNRGSWQTTALGTIDGTFSGSLTLGPSTTGFGYGWKGAIAHLATFNTGLSDADLEQVEDYFANQIGVSLP